MIIDWLKTCKEIHESKRLKESDSTEIKSKYKQEIIYLQYLTSILHYDPKKCYNEWKKIQNGVAKTFEGDVEQVVSQFYFLFKKALKSHYPDVRLSKALEPINVYRQEVDYLNGLDMPLWTKCYLLALAVYYKFKKQYGKEVCLTTQVANWALKQCPYIAEGKRKVFSDYEEQIRKWLNKVGEDIVTYKYDYFGKRKKSYQLSFLQKSGEVVYSCNDINCVADALHLLTGHINAHHTYRHYVEKVCSSCGKVFLVTGNSKTDLCPECYKIYRRKKESNRVNAYQKAKRAKECEKMEKS